MVDNEEIFNLNNDSTGKQINDEQNKSNIIIKGRRVKRRPKNVYHFEESDSDNDLDDRMSVKLDRKKGELSLCNIKSLPNKLLSTSGKILTHWNESSSKLDLSLVEKTNLIINKITGSTSDIVFPSDLKTTSEAVFDNWCSDFQDEYKENEDKQEAEVVVHQDINDSAKNRRIDMPTTEMLAIENPNNFNLQNDSSKTDPIEKTQQLLDQRFNETSDVFSSFNSWFTNISSATKIAASTTVTHAVKKLTSNAQNLLHNSVVVSKCDNDHLPANNADHITEEETNWDDKWDKEPIQLKNKSEVRAICEQEMMSDSDKHKFEDNQWNNDDWEEWSNDDVSLQTDPPHKDTSYDELNENSSKIIHNALQSSEFIEEVDGDENVPLSAIKRDSIRDKNPTTLVSNEDVIFGNEVDFWNPDKFESTSDSEPYAYLGLENDQVLNKISLDTEISDRSLICSNHLEFPNKSESNLIDDVIVEKRIDIVNMPTLNLNEDNLLTGDSNNIYLKEPSTHTELTEDLEVLSTNIENIGGFNIYGFSALQDQSVFSWPEKNDFEVFNEKSIFADNVPDLKEDSLILNDSSQSFNFELDTGDKQDKSYSNEMFQPTQSQDVTLQSLTSTEMKSTDLSIIVTTLPFENDLDVQTNSLTKPIDFNNETMLLNDRSIGNDRDHWLNPTLDSTNMHDEANYSEHGSEPTEILLPATTLIPDTLVTTELVILNNNCELNSKNDGSSKMLPSILSQDITLQSVAPAEMEKGTVSVKNDLDVLSNSISNKLIGSNHGTMTTNYESIGNDWNDWHNETNSTLDITTVQMETINNVGKTDSSSNTKDYCGELYYEEVLQTENEAYGDWDAELNSDKLEVQSIQESSCDRLEGLKSNVESSDVFATNAINQKDLLSQSERVQDKCNASDSQNFSKSIIEFPTLDDCLLNQSNARNDENNFNNTLSENNNLLQENNLQGHNVCDEIVNGWGDWDDEDSTILLNNDLREEQDVNLPNLSLYKTHLCNESSNETSSEEDHTSLKHCQPLLKTSFPLSKSDTDLDQELLLENCQQNTHLNIAQTEILNQIDQQAVSNKEDNLILNIVYSNNELVENNIEITEPNQSLPGPIEKQLNLETVTWGDFNCERILTVNSELCSNTELSRQTSEGSKEIKLEESTSNANIWEENRSQPPPLISISSNVEEAWSNWDSEEVLSQHESESAKILVSTTAVQSDTLINSDLFVQNNICELESKKEGSTKMPHSIKSKDIITSVAPNKKEISENNLVDTITLPAEIDTCVHANSESSMLTELVGSNNMEDIFPNGQSIGDGWEDWSNETNPIETTVEIERNDEQVSLTSSYKQNIIAYDNSTANSSLNLDLSNNSNQTKASKYEIPLPSVIETPADKFNFPSQDNWDEWPEETNFMPFSISKASSLVKDDLTNTIDLKEPESNFVSTPLVLANQKADIDKLEPLNQDDWDEWPTDNLTAKNLKLKEKIEYKHSNRIDQTASDKLTKSKMSFDTTKPKSVELNVSSNPIRSNKPNKFKFNVVDSWESSETQRKYKFKLNEWNSETKSTVSTDWSAEWESPTPRTVEMKPDHGGNASHEHVPKPHLQPSLQAMRMTNADSSRAHHSTHQSNNATTDPYSSYSSGWFENLKSATKTAAVTTVTHAVKNWSFNPTNLLDSVVDNLSNVVGIPSAEEMASVMKQTQPRK